uniref:Uncharacterized protein n=1 Tax=Sipha flava TaxID=143950 RepID=A0A2S2QKR6_9HEMI
METVLFLLAKYLLIKICDFSLEMENNRDITTLEESISSEKYFFPLKVITFWAILMVIFFKFYCKKILTFFYYMVMVILREHENLIECIESFLLPLKFLKVC